MLTKVHLAEKLAPAWAELEIFDPQGRRVATVFRGLHPAGPMTHRWLPTGAVASGVYLARLRSNGRGLPEKFAFVR